MRSSEVPGRAPRGRWRQRLFAAVAAIALLVVLLPATVLAADPSPTQGSAGDPRSAGEGPGLVGDPTWAIGIVLAIAALSLIASLAYVRLSSDRGGSNR